MSLYLYGIARAMAPLDLGPIGFPGPPAALGRVSTIPCDSFAAVVGPSPREDFRQVPKEEVVRLLLSHQQTLETVMRRFFVLPFKFGTMVRDEEELAAVVSERRAFLTDLFARMEGTVEIDVVATWAVPQILQEIAEKDPEIVSCKAKVAEGRGDLAFVGMLLAHALQRKADEWRNGIVETLKPCAEASTDHDLLNDAMVLNSSFLARKEKEADFYQGVERADALYGGRLVFRCVGPLPPYSFATLTIKHFDPTEIAGAAQILRLSDLADLSQIKKTYRELSRQCHPDVRSDRPDTEFERLHQAYELICDYCRDGSKPLSGGDVHPFARLDIASERVPAVQGARRAA